jgi:hypothetical protein
VRGRLVSWFMITFTRTRWLMVLFSNPSCMLHIHSDLMYTPLHVFYPLGFFSLSLFVAVPFSSNSSSFN